MKVLPLHCKRLDLRMARMATENGDPVSSRRRKNSVPYYYLRVKYNGCLYTRLLSETWELLSFT